jgi:hypothetical protein
MATGTTPAADRAPAEGTFRRPEGTVAVGAIERMPSSVAASIAANRGSSFGG